MPPVRTLPQVQQEQQDMLLRQLNGMMSHWNTVSTDACPINAALSKVEMARSALQLFTARSGPYRELLESVHAHLFHTIDILDDHHVGSTQQQRAVTNPQLVAPAAEGSSVIDDSADSSQLVADKRSRQLDRQLKRTTDSHETDVQQLRSEIDAKDAEILKLKELMHMQETRRIRGGGGGVGQDGRSEPVLSLDDDPTDDLRFPLDADATIRRLEKIKEHDTAIGRLRLCQEENAKLLQHISSVKELNGRYAMQASELAARVMALRDHNDRLATSLALRQDEFMQLERENEVMKAELTDLAQVGHGGRMNFLLDFGGGDDSPIESSFSTRNGEGTGTTATTVKKATGGLRMHSMSFDQVAELRYAVYCIGSGMAVPRHLRGNGILPRVRLSKDVALFAVADILSLRQTPRFPTLAYTIAAATQAPIRNVRRQVPEADSLHQTKYVDLPTFIFNYLVKRHGVDAIAWGYALDDCTRLFESDVNLNSFGQVTRGFVSELIFRTINADVLMFLQLCERLDIRTVSSKRRQQFSHPHHAVTEGEEPFASFSPFGEPQSVTDVVPPPIVESPFEDPPVNKASSRGVHFKSRTNSNALPPHLRPTEPEPTMTLTSLQVLAVLHEMYPGYPDSAFRSLQDSLQSSLGADNTIYYNMMFPNAERIQLQQPAGDPNNGDRSFAKEPGFMRHRNSRAGSVASLNLNTLTPGGGPSSGATTSDYAFLPNAAELRPENSFSNLFKMLILDDAVITMQTVCDAISGLPGAKVTMLDISDAVRDALDGRSELIVSDLLSRIRRVVHAIANGESISIPPSDASSSSLPATPNVATVLPPIPKVDLVAVLRVHVLLRQATVRPRALATPAASTNQINRPSIVGDQVVGGGGDDAGSDEAGNVGSESTAARGSMSVSRVAFDNLIQRPFFKEYATRLEVLAEQDVGDVVAGASVNMGGLGSTFDLNPLPMPAKNDPLNPSMYELDGLITESDVFLRNHASIAL